MLSAVLESLFGFVLLLLFIGKFLKVGPLLKVNEVWASLGSKVNFIKKWWFNLIFVGITIALISAPIMESKASKLGVDRSEYSKLETDGRLYGMTAEQYFEESKKAKDSGYENTASFIESKKMGIDNANDYASAKKLSAKDKAELQVHFDEMKKRGTNSIDQYVKLIEIEQAENKKKIEAERLVMEKKDYDHLGRHKKTVCKNYAESRQECAAAANFKQCMNIKDKNTKTNIGTDNPMWEADQYICNQDGSVRL